jgi:hypothetical protein
MKTASVGETEGRGVGGPPMKHEISRKRWKEALELVKQ